jgi:beta-galactosidase
MFHAKLPGIWFGGDYNPDQWPEEVWQDDVRLMREANVNVVSLGIFSWSQLQSGPERYHFEWMDRVIDLLYEHSVHVNLATPTACPPAWMVKRHPDILPVDARGATYRFGSRRHYCPNSPSFRRGAAEIARRLAQRYRSHPGLVMWHVDNEYGCHFHLCYCRHCEGSFRLWLQRRYGSLERLNEAWTTAFWGQRYYDWEEIDLPRHSPYDHNPAHALDYRRFMSDSFLETFMLQREILKAETPDVPVTTNLMGWFSGLDYFRWAGAMDFVAWDSYPGPGFTPFEPASAHDLMRGLKGGRLPFLLMEQAPSAINWEAYNPQLRPGEMRLISFQAVARGADAVMYFQWRQSQGGAEKFMDGIVGHDMSDTSRRFRQVADLGAELKRLAPVAGAEVRAEAAILYDYPSAWAAEQRPTPTKDLRVAGEVKRCYRELFEQNIAVDIVHPSSDLTGYRLVIAPCLRIVTPEQAAALETYVRGGGMLVVTFASGLTDENDRAVLGGYPAYLRGLLGLRVEELDVLTPAMTNRAVVQGEYGRFRGEYGASLWCDVITLEGARALATFASDYYAGRPAVTEQRLGAGRALYLGTALDRDGVRDLLLTLCEQAGLHPPLQAPAGVEVTQRWQGEEPFTFVLNHNPHEVTVALDGPRRDLLSGRTAASFALGARDVMVLAPPGR